MEIKNDGMTWNMIWFLGIKAGEGIRQLEVYLVRLREVFESFCEWNKNRFLEYKTRHPAQLSFPTAIEAEFQIKLGHIIAQL